MPRTIFLCLFGLIAGAFGIVLWNNISSTPTDETAAAKVGATRSVALCPWREPTRDLKVFFPDATGYRTEVRVLSAFRAELEKRLGHAPATDEIALQVNQALHDDKVVGAICVRRVKGEHGAIELVLATTPNGSIAGVRCQRLREPPEISKALLEGEWLTSLRGKTVASPLRMGEDIPAVSPEAQSSARAVLDGIRDLLILLETSAKPGVLVNHH